MSRPEIQKEVIQGIYKIENTKTHKVYIGQSKDIYKRWSQHQYKLEHNKHHSPKLQNSYNRTKDKSIFEYSIVEIVENKEDLDAREKYYIDKYNSLYDGYNCADVGDFLNEKIIKKRIDKIKQGYYYSIFANLYNPDIVRFSQRWLDKLDPDRMHYSWSSMRRLCIILKWFYDNYYNKDNSLALHVTVSYDNCFVARIRKDNEEIESYRFKVVKNKYIPEWDWYKDKPVADEKSDKWIFDFKEIDQELKNILKNKGAKGVVK